MKDQQTQPGKKERQCLFCQSNVADIDYKDTQLLRRFLSSFAKIVPRKRSRACQWHQRKLENAVKRARIMALIPFIQR